MSGAANDPGRLRDEAAGWLNLRRSGEMSEAELVRFTDWLARGEGEREAYARLERHWHVLGLVANEPMILAAREHDARTHDRRLYARRGLMAVAAAVVLTLTSWATMDSGVLGDLGFARGGGETLRTGTGQRTTTTLADGSVITLDGQSELKVVEMAAVRRIKLIRGRAYFQVAKDHVHPFLVQAGDKTVRAVGTAFDVSVEGSAVTVTLVEGKVRVDEPKRLFGSSHSAELVPGGKLVADPGKSWVLSRVDAGQETSWLSGRLTFFHDPLASAVAEVNRHSARKIVFSGGLTPDTRIVGVFRAGDTDAFTTALELNGIARVVSRTDDEIELAPK